jgi:hypothetical protein
VTRANPHASIGTSSRSSSDSATIVSGNEIVSGMPERNSTRTIKNQMSCLPTVIGKTSTTRAADTAPPVSSTRRRWR